jgi:hypothetical protein
MMNAIEVIVRIIDELLPVGGGVAIGPLVGLACAIRVGAAVGIEVGAIVAVGIDVGDIVTVGVPAPTVGVGVKVPVGMRLGVGLIVAAIVGATVGVDVGILVGVAVGILVTIGVAEGVADCATWLPDAKIVKVCVTIFTMPNLSFAWIFILCCPAPRGAVGLKDQKPVPSVLTVAVGPDSIVIFTFSFGRAVPRNRGWLSLLYGCFCKIISLSKCYRWQIL